MRSIEATITGQGQVTISAEVRTYLGVTKRDRVAFLIEEDGVRLVPARFTVATAYGSIPAIPGVSADFDDEIEAAIEDELHQTDDVEMAR